MAKRDFYEILGVDKDADAATLKSAYRKQAMQYHPDRNPGDEQAEASFKEALRLRPDNAQAHFWYAQPLMWKQLRVH